MLRQGVPFLGNLLSTFHCQQVGAIARLTPFCSFCTAVYFYSKRGATSAEWEGAKMLWEMQLQGTHLRL